jgi:hypothetical protein
LGSCILLSYLARHGEREFGFFFGVKFSQGEACSLLGHFCASEWWGLFNREILQVLFDLISDKGDQFLCSVYVIHILP